MIERPSSSEADVYGGEAARAKKSLGQNFLVDANIQRKIVDALGAAPSDEVLEIGPGRGALTRHLVDTVRRLTLVELDDALAGALQGRFAERPDVHVVHGDILDVDLAALLEDAAEARVIGNIPYNITTPIIFRLLERPRPREIILMVQHEVADRITAAVGTKAYGALSVGIRTVARVERLFKVGRGAFRPVPRVDSAIVRITPIRPEPLDSAQEERVRRLVRAAFQWRRKQLRKILRDHPDLRVEVARIDTVLDALGILPEARPETLDPERFVALADALS
ncbi:MAG: 16S rRNA (adenine(1518)-N(6)/adenine(1519)-N(6))-dimethyltransferase RsmA [Longimicrobiales bacterium]|jgi:16S rRNA (adenine1518-N6/adenine1519-N6)-dimethyltransferase|nr:16S rRNA (adenine(1518)-N(6)/adenine(1519)-N(6))-dimethyltransferase RsmA [Longimicrobiales bacterium]